MKTKVLKFIIPVATLAITSCVEGTKKPNTKTGFVKADEVTMVSSDFNNAYAPSKGDVKLLVVPISFVGDAKDQPSDKYVDWTDSLKNDVQNIYFGQSDSLYAYYSAASFNQLHISGMVAPTYENSTITTSSIRNDNSCETLFQLIEDAVSWLEDTQTSINWSEYDLNQDGCIDNIHLITDFYEEDWGTTLWPHMWQTNIIGTVERPSANVYSISGTGFMSNAVTAIHEQGHIFGLQDYYDYTPKSEIDYVGGFDMQSQNCFDWNSFSKLSMGWVKPYVINGEADVTTVNIKAASINGDCILIPADYSSWNGSAFDEYFLLELFAPFGNNKKDWQKYQSSLGYKPGIRLYHVDARMYGSNSLEPYAKEDGTYDNKLKVEDLETQQIKSKEDIAKWNKRAFGANNSSNWIEGNEGIAQLADKPMLTLVQKGKEFTFASKNGRHTLSANDLFKPSDTFSFEDYSIFLNKEAEVQELTNKGEDFPYTFTVDYVDEDEATITFNKVKH